MVAFFFSIVGARSLVRIFFSSRRSSLFSCFSFCFFYCCFADLILCFSFSFHFVFFPSFLCFLVFSFLYSLFLSFSFIFTLLWSRAETQKMKKKKTKENDSARYVCIFIRYMYNVLGSAIITIIQLCGLCRLFVHSTLPPSWIAVVAIARANIHHQPSKLCRSFSGVAFCVSFVGRRLWAEAAVDSSIACIPSYSSSSLSLSLPAHFSWPSSIFCICAFLRKRASSAQFMDRRHSRFSLFVMCVCLCVCIMYTMYTFVVDVGGVSAAMWWNAISTWFPSHNRPSLR